MTRALPLALLLSGCSSVTPFVVTGKTLAALDNQVADVGLAMNAGLDSGKVSKEDYRKWAEFAKRFKTFNPMAVAAWKTAVDLNDAALAGDFGAAIARLAEEFAPFVEFIQKAGLYASP